MIKNKNHTQYSPLTIAVIEKYMKSTNVLTLQKRVILNELKKGKPLPVSVLETKILETNYNHKKVIFTSKRNKKRRRDTIINGGAYDVPRFIPETNLRARLFSKIENSLIKMFNCLCNEVDREKEKERLQNICSGIDQIPDEDYEVQKLIRTNSEKISENERMRELMDEIEERIEFLNQVEKYGLKRKYELEISNEISQKLKQLEDFKNRMRTHTGYVMN